jgi:hypothetical protein
MADAADSKSVARKGVWVRLPPPAPMQIPNEFRVTPDSRVSARKLFSLELNRFNIARTPFLLLA